MRKSQFTKVWDLYTLRDQSFLTYLLSCSWSSEVPVQSYRQLCVSPVQASHVRCCGVVLSGAQ